MRIVRRWAVEGSNVVCAITRPPDPPANNDREESHTETSKMNRQPKGLWLGLGLAIALLNALILFVLIPKASTKLHGLYSEDQYQDGYDQLAANLASGNGYRFYPNTAETLMREPGYPVLLAGIYRVFGSSFVYVKLVNMILAFAAAYLLMLIARRISGNWLVAFGAPLLFLFHPGTLAAESRGSVEILFTLVLTIYVFTVYRAAKSDRWQDHVASGVALGATMLVRSTPILFPLVLFGYVLAFERHGRNFLVLTRNFALTILAMFLVMSPWVVRNYLLTEKFVPTASVLGVAAQTGLYFSTHPEIGNVQMDWDASQERNQLARELGYPFKIGYYQYFYSPTDELAFSQFLSQRVVREYEMHPLIFLKTLALNTLKFWCGGKTEKSVVIDAILQFPFLILAIAGTVLCIKGSRTTLIAPLALLCVYLVGVSVPILAQARYSEPLIPFMSILAVIALLALKQKLEKRNYVLSEIVP